MKPPPTIIPPEENQGDTAPPTVLLEPSKIDDKIPMDSVVPEYQEGSSIAPLEKEDAVLKVPPGYSANEYWDVLPSFQMYQSILRRHLQNIDHEVSETIDMEDPDEQDNHSITDHPPEYPSPPPAGSLQMGNTPLISTTGSRITTTDITNQPFSPPLTPSASATSFSPHTHPASTPEASNTAAIAASTLLARSTFDLVVDSVDSLKRMEFSPIDVQIYVTKDIPRPGHDSVPETTLKEYTNAEFVYGYMIIHNTSATPMPFEMFTVSLEGTEVITSLSRPVKFMKKFLRMFDLSACWSYDTIINSLGIEYEHFSKDTTDRSIYLGLPDNRILKPNTKYKKFFSFRFPLHLLDNTCPHPDQRQHFNLPPSLGLDKSLVTLGNKNLDASRLTLNNTLGYGCLPKRGSPILTRDYVYPLTAIQYTIEARFIGKRTDGNLNIEDLLNYKEMHRHFLISAAANHHLRFIPNQAFQNSQPSLDYEAYLTNLIKIESNPKKQLARLQEAVEKALHRLAAEKAMRARALADSHSVNETVTALKASQLYSTTSSGSNIFTLDTPTSSRAMSPALSAYTSRNLNLADDEFEDYYSDYADDEALITSLATYEVKKFLSLKKGIIKLTFNKRANVHTKQPFTDTIPPVPYLVAPLIAAENSLSELHKDYATRHRQFTDYRFVVEFEFQPTGGSQADAAASTSEKPPRLVSFQVSLLALTIKSEKPIPVKLSSEFFLPDIHVNGSNQVPMEVNHFNRKLKTRFAGYRDRFTAFEHNEGPDSTPLPQTTVDDVDSILDMTHSTSDISLFEIKNYNSGTWERHTAKPLIRLPPLGSTSSISACLDDSTNKKTWRRKAGFTLDFVKNVKDAIVPSFQSCLMARIYCLRIKAVFDGGNQSYLHIPIEVSV